jgi:N-acetylneuraminic acid mutarotase
MRKLYIILTVFTLFTLSLSAQITTSSQWTWMKGDSAIDQKTVYGNLGIAAPQNTPGARNGSISWTDNSGNLWLYGGQENSPTNHPGCRNDLWKYDISTNQWTWVKGDSIYNVHCVYGSLGITNPANKPSARYGSSTWTDNFGNLWLFGGTMVDADNYYFSYNDLWKYSPSINQWTWMNGDSTTENSPDGHFSIYGTKGIADVANKPGTLEGGFSWKDGSGNLWLFGGGGYAAPTSTGGALNDLWKYSPSSNQWTWVYGDSTGNVYGECGTQGVEAITNKPGGREWGVSWVDASGNFWVFGGFGMQCTPWLGNGYLNDLWKYNPNTNQWTWMKGSNRAYQ